MRFNVSVIGGGSWGTTVAALVSRNADSILWARDSKTVREINESHSNSKYLPNARLPDKLLATDNLEQAVADSDLVAMAVPSQNFRNVLENLKAHVRPWIPIISLTKGLESSSNMRMSEIIQEVLPGHPVGILSGPNLSREIMAGSAAATVLAMEDPIIVKEVQGIFNSGLFRVYTNHDVIGCELGGVLKNIIAIATGMGDGLGAGDNTRAALITRGLAEITRLGVAMGGEAATFAGLAGMGDLLATCTSPQSRNRTVGFELGRGRRITEIIDEMYMVAEGVKSAPIVLQLAEKHQVDMPIVNEVYKVLTEQSKASQAFRGLLRYEAGAESQSG